MIKDTNKRISLTLDQPAVEQLDHLKDCFNGMVTTSELLRMLIEKGLEETDSKRT